MAEVSYLQFYDEDEEDRSDAVITLDSTPQWPQEFDVYVSDLDFSPSDVPPIPANTQSIDRQNQVNFVMDLFHQRVEQSSSRVVIETTNPNFYPTFGFIQGDHDMGSNHLDLDLDLGLGLGFQMNEHDDDNGNSGFMVADGGDDFFVSRRDAVSESGESSTVSGGPEYFMGGLGVIDVGSDSEDGDNEVVGIDLNVVDDYGCDDVDDSALPLCWDSFQLEDHRDVNEDFEWEEVDGRVDEREVLSMYFDAEGDDDSSVLAVISSGEEVGGERGPALGNLEWEVLFNVHTLEPNPNEVPDGEPYFGDHDEYEMLFGQFAENENAMMGRPPASKMAVENLLSVVMTKEDVENGNTLCAVCKDEIYVGERAKQLPCTHRYHGDCIVPWLGIRNTCPVCRFELPTDDPNYERRMAQRANHAQ